MNTFRFPVPQVELPEGMRPTDTIRWGEEDAALWITETWPTPQELEEAHRILEADLPRHPNGLCYEYGALPTIDTAIKGYHRRWTVRTVV